jgi:AcrR family transcriptional regulator
MPIRSSDARRERAREHTRRDILLAAAEVFARRGYAAATLAELAEAAGFAAPSLYRYFESKEEIFRSLVELLVEEMRATFDEPVDRALPLPARLEALLRAQARLAESRRAALRLVHDAGPDAPLPEKHKARGPRAGLAFFEGQMLGWLRRNATAAELRVGPELAARTLAGVAFAFHSCDDGAGSSLEAARTVVDLALNGIAAPRNGRRGA